MQHIGLNSYISPKAKIIGFHNETPRVFVLGDNCYIGDDVQIICDNFIMGDYGKIHNHTTIHGNSVRIGHNAWIGQGAVLDGLGGIGIGNNFAVGPYSLLWSHAKFGDALEGCRWDSMSFLEIGNDVWLAGGHTIVHPVIIQDKAMSLAGAVITKDMLSNHVYAGVPAKDITETFGPQFKPVSIEYRMDFMNKTLKEFGWDEGIKIVETVNDFKDDWHSYFAVLTREYTKRSTLNEIAFMKYLLPSKGKFIPYKKA